MKLRLIMSKKIVLFVDDEIEILEIIEDVLKDSPFNVICAESGKTALDYSKKHKINLIVCDLILNDISGLEVLTHFKENHPNTYRILTTGYLDEKQENYCREIGVFQKIIQKPWDIYEIRDQITKAVA